MALDLGIFLEGAQSTFKVKVSENDAQAQYLIDKLISSDGSVTITETNNGGVETIDLTASSGGDNFANADLTLTGNRTHDLDSNLLTFDVGTTLSLLQKGMVLDASNIYYTSINSLPVLEVTNNNGQTFNVTASGFIQTYSDLGNTIAKFHKRGGTQGLSLLSNSSVLASDEFKFQNTFTGGNDYLTIEIKPTYSQMYMATGGTFEHWIRTGSAAQATFFRSGFNGNGFNVGGTGPVGSEDISLQGSTLIQGLGSTSATTSLLVQNSSASEAFKILDDLAIIMANLPTSSAGLATGQLWNNSGVVNIV